jgi:hypothetical protein
MAVEEELLQVLIHRVVRPLYGQFQRNRASRTQKRLTAAEQRRMLYTKLNDTRRTAPETDANWRQVQPQTRHQIIDRTFTELTDRIQQLQQEQQLTQELLDKFEADMQAYVNRTDFDHNNRDDHRDHDLADDAERGEDETLAADESQEEQQQNQQADQQQEDDRRRREEVQREEDQRRREQEERGEDPAVGTAVVAGGAVAAVDEFDQEAEQQQQADQQLEAEQDAVRPDWESVTTSTEVQTEDAQDLDERIQSGQDLDLQSDGPDRQSAQDLEREYAEGDLTVDQAAQAERGDPDRGVEEGQGERGIEGSPEFLPTGQDEQDAAQAAAQNGDGQPAPPRAAEEGLLDEKRAERAGQQGQQEPDGRPPVDERSANAGLTGTRTPVAVAPTEPPTAGRGGVTPGAAARQLGNREGGSRGSDGPELKQ